MLQNPRRKVVDIRLRPYTGPSDLFKECATAILECGHEIDCGVSVKYAKARKRMACEECGSAPRRQ